MARVTNKFQQLQSKNAFNRGCSIWTSTKTTSYYNEYTSKAISKNQTFLFHLFGFKMQNKKEGGGEKKKKRMQNVLVLRSKRKPRRQDLACNCFSIVMVTWQSCKASSLIIFCTGQFLIQTLKLSYHFCALGKRLVNQIFKKFYFQKISVLQSTSA